jgi:hypothetical protein
LGCCLKPGRCLAYTDLLTYFRALPDNFTFAFASSAAAYTRAKDRRLRGFLAGPAGTSIGIRYWYFARRADAACARQQQLPPGGSARAQSGPVAPRSGTSAAGGVVSSAARFQSGTTSPEARRGAIQAPPRHRAGAQATRPGKTYHRDDENRKQPARHEGV